MTQLKTPPSLREQIIDAMKEYGVGLANPVNPEYMFDTAIMPVLQKAIDAGQLLVGRNTKDRVPVQEGIITWMESVIAHIVLEIRPQEAIISKRKCLNIIYQFGKYAEVALNDARVHNHRVKQEEH